MFLRLCYCDSPFLCTGERRPEHVAQFLWALSPGYAAGDDTKSIAKRRAFIREIALTVPYQKSRDQIEEFLDLMFFDAPSPDGKPIPPRVALATKLIDKFALEYCWSMDAILDSPMPVLFQLLKQMAIRKNPEYCAINRLSDKVRQKWAVEIEEWGKRESDKQNRKHESGPKAQVDSKPRDETRARPARPRSAARRRVVR
jgi:hypothetical protein